jgi:hypothetical protein
MLKRGKSWCYTLSICISSKHDINIMFVVGDRQRLDAQVVLKFWGDSFSLDGRGAKHNQYIGDAQHEHQWMLMLYVLYFQEY